MARAAASKLKCITLDVTGTLLAYKGHLGDYYCRAAKKAGQTAPDYTKMHQAFKRAYVENTLRHPCFGQLHGISNEKWWRSCVRDAFVYAGENYSDATHNEIFADISRAFSTTEAYDVYPDAQPFLRWARHKMGLRIGIISNATNSYPDSILPALGLSKGREWDFGVFSGVDGLEKPDLQIFRLALERSGGLDPGSVLHIGDSVPKDIEPAFAIGMGAILLDRFGRPEVPKWRADGIPVVTDLLEARDLIMDMEGLAQTDELNRVKEVS